MRRSCFIKNVGISTIGTPFLITALQSGPELPFDQVVVKEFVGAAHRDKDKVTDMLGEYPTLLNVAHDWGNGDFETALGAAQHVGFKELAGILIENGAQANIFTACLYGHLAIVKMFLENHPASLHAKGPHGFTLLHHAIRGGEEALPVKTYLESLGAVETKMKIF